LLPRVCADHIPTLRVIGQAEIVFDAIPFFDIEPSAIGKAEAIIDKRDLCAGIQKLRHIRNIVRVSICRQAASPQQPEFEGVPERAFEIGVRFDERLDIDIIRGAQRQIVVIERLGFQRDFDVGERKGIVFEIIKLRKR